MLLDMSFNFIDQINTSFQQGMVYLKPWCFAIGILWIINVANWIVGSTLNYFGIQPRRIFGLIGILVSPIPHKNFSHLLFNSIPLFFLGLAILSADGAMQFYWVTLVVAILGGLLTWLCARPGLHIGASGVISGYFGYILISAYRSPGVVTILLAVLCFYYFGAIIGGLIPKNKYISWEGHLFGFASGILCAYIPNWLLFLPH